MIDYETLFPSLPDEARVWIYTADRLLSEDEQTALLDTLRPFLAQWTSHSRRVIGEAAILEDRIVVVAATLLEGDISGCGIDASTHAIEDAGRSLNIEWLRGLTVLYRDSNGTVQAATRPSFRELVRNGAVHAGTPVFDTSLTTLAGLRGGKLERAAGESWHRTAFQIPVGAL